MNNNPLTRRAFWLGVLFSGLFAWLTVRLENGGTEWSLTATQVAVMPYLLLIAIVLAVNPLMRLCRVVRILAPSELLLVFLMGAVSSGISTFGMSAQLVPIMSSLYNRHWNTPQARWDLYIEPFVGERYFVAQPGIQAAAQVMRSAEIEWRESAAVLRAARDVETSRGEVERAEAALADVDKVGNRRERAIRTAEARHQLELARATYDRARGEWEPYGAQHRMEVVLEQYPARVTELEGRAVRAREALAALEEKAFVLIDEFRRGMPEGRRAVPGFVYRWGEGRLAYRYRLARLWHGSAAARELRHAAAALAGTEPGAAPAAARQHIEAAVARLAPIAEASIVQQAEEQVQARLQTLKAEVETRDRELQALRNRLQYTAKSGQWRLQWRIDRQARRLQAVSRELGELETYRGQRIQSQMRLVKKVAAVHRALADLLAAAATDGPAAWQERAGRELQEQLAALDLLDTRFRAFLLGDIPWGAWLPPLGRWALVIFLTYGVLMAFNVLIFRQWAHNEKLCYPLAELPAILAGVKESKPGLLPPVFRSGMFWTGFAIAVSVLGWNQLVKLHILSGMGEIQLKFLWRPYIEGSVLEGLGPKVQHEIFFTLIGLSFLVPANISYSMWFFQFFYMGLLLVLVWLGLGSNEASFRADMGLILNFRTAAGGGALCVFAAYILWKCRDFLFYAWRPSKLQELEPDERREMRVCSAVFVLGSVALVALMTWGMGASLGHSIFFYLMFLAVTIGLVRAVAEGGILGFQCWFGPAQFLRSMFGMNRAWTLPQLFMPLLVYQYVLFLDIKTFLAPAMANALKLRDAVRLSRGRFHGALAAGIAVAFVVGVGTHIFMAYERGADSMHLWFYQGGPTRALDSMRTIAMTNPVDTAGGRTWLIAGAVGMLALLFFRSRFFWVPHPIGLILWVSPIMGAYWFSILLGWLFKSMVSKYGDNHTYAQFRDLFIGLIVGELVLCLFGIDLNRTYFW